jgi:hypothetical protein
VGGGGEVRGRVASGRRENVREGAVIGMRQDEVQRGTLRMYEACARCGARYGPHAECSAIYHHEEDIQVD